MVVAKSESPAATFSARPANGNQFRTLPDKADLYSGDLLVSLPGGMLASKNGAVTVKSLADFDRRSALPILETRPQPGRVPRTVDLDLTLDRGRMDIDQHEGRPVPRSVRVRFWDQSWKIVLDAPGTHVAIELCGRWPSGTRFKLARSRTANPRTRPAPVASLVLLVLDGTASVDVGGATVAMKAPPGPAELAWNSLTGARPQPQKLEKVPDWADPATESERGWEEDRSGGGEVPRGPRRRPRQGTRHIPRVFRSHRTARGARGARESRRPGAAGQVARCGQDAR